MEWTLRIFNILYSSFSKWIDFRLVLAIRRVCLCVHKFPVKDTLKSYAIKSILGCDVYVRGVHCLPLINSR